jgi:hypothetical protein
MLQNISLILGLGQILWINDLSDNMDMRYETYNRSFLEGRFTCVVIKRTTKIKVGFSGSAGGQMRGRWQ